MLVSTFLTWVTFVLVLVCCWFFIYLFILCLIMFLSIYHSYHVQSMLFLWFLWASVRFCLPGFYCCHHQFITPSTFLQLVPLVSLPLPSSPASCFSITAVVTSVHQPWFIWSPGCHSENQWSVMRVFHRVWFLTPLCLVWDSLFCCNVSFKK